MTKDVLRTCLPTYLCEHLISKKFSRKSFVGAGNQTGVTLITILIENVFSQPQSNPNLLGICTSTTCQPGSSKNFNQLRYFIKLYWKLSLWDWPMYEKVSQFTIGYGSDMKFAKILFFRSKHFRLFKQYLMIIYQMQEKLFRIVLLFLH